MNDSSRHAREREREREEMRSEERGELSIAYRRKSLLNFIFWINKLRAHGISARLNELIGTEEHNIKFAHRGICRWQDRLKRDSLRTMWNTRIRIAIRLPTWYIYIDINIYRIGGTGKRLPTPYELQDVQIQLRYNYNLLISIRRRSQQRTLRVFDK